MAAKLGAREVFLYEAAEVAGVAAKVLKANGARNCHLFPCHSTEMVDPPKVDVVVSETLGNYALEEHIVETLADARKRFLKPGGRADPAQARAVRGAGRQRPPASRVRRLGCDRLRSLRRQDDEPQQHLRAHAVGEGAARRRRLWDAIDLGSDSRSSRKGEAGWKLKAATTIYGFATWWSAELAPGIALSTAPDAPRTHWEQLYFPLLSPIAAKAGETVGIALRSRTSPKAGTHVAWVATHSDAKGREVGRQSLNLDKGFLP